MGEAVIAIRCTQEPLVEMQGTDIFRWLPFDKLRNRPSKPEIEQVGYEQGLKPEERLFKYRIWSSK